jgi:uncharacterized membrane protein YhaH (DUF805 family)
MTHFFKASISGFKRTFDFRSTASRGDFWYFMLLFVVLYLVVATVDEVFVASAVSIQDLPLGQYIPMGMIDPEVGVLVLMYRPVMGIPTLSVTIRRLHDVGKSGWWSLLWILPLPLLGWFYLIPLLCRPTLSKDS